MRDDILRLVPHLLSILHDAPDVYFDSISRVTVPHWSTGRVVLLGDAAWGVTLGGMGVGTGIVAAYVLAGELAAARGDHRTALTAYETGCAATPRDGSAAPTPASSWPRRLPPGSGCETPCSNPG